MERAFDLDVGLAFFLLHFAVVDETEIDDIHRNLWIVSEFELRPNGSLDIPFGDGFGSGGKFVFSASRSMPSASAFSALIRARPKSIGRGVGAPERLRDHHASADPGDGSDHR